MVCSHITGRPTSDHFGDPRSQRDLMMHAQTPDQLHRLFIAACNGGDVEAILALYESTARLVSPSGDVTHGQEENRQALQELLILTCPLSMTIVYAIPSNDLALLRGQWRLNGSSIEGKPIKMTGHNLQIARRQLEGNWLFVIDYLIGTAPAPLHPLAAHRHDKNPLIVKQSEATIPEALHPLFVEAFNNSDLEMLLSLYEPQATMIPKPHQIVHRHDGIRRALQQLLSLNARFTLTTVFWIQAESIALLCGKWGLHGIGPHGQIVATSGNDVEVVRRQADGTWRFVIDHAYGLTQ